MVEVAVIGAGAAGLVASRHLLGTGLRPLIFETSKAVGGSWASSNPNSKMWKGLTTNLSKHTCRFSEWPWPAGTPTFVQPSEMYAYLDSFANEFVDPECFKFQCQVDYIGKTTPAEGQAENSESEQLYRVEWTDLATNSKHSKDFHGVVVATGFFSKPHWPTFMDGSKVWIDDNNNADNDSASSSPKLIHSSDYTNHEDFANETVAVVGSSFSALEICVDISQSASRVVNVLPSVPWVLPRYVPRNGSILPVDLALYQRAKDFPQVPEQTAFTPESARTKHAFLQSMVGEKQQDSPLGIPKDWDSPPSVAISDHYLDLVVGGAVEVIHGRLEGVDNETGDVKVKTSSGETDQSLILPKISKVICCTGYECNLDDFLDQSILDTLDYNGTDTFSPMTLAWDTIHPSLPNLAFCGMYRGPYMGIMELQGRVAARSFAGQVPEKLDDALDTSKNIREYEPRAQFPHFDYIGEMDTVTVNALSEDAFPKANVHQGDIISPAFYQSKSEEISKACQEELQQEVSKSPDRMPQVVASAIVGEWDFDRNIVHLSDKSSSPTGNKRERVHGTIKYSRSKKLDSVKYREDGLYELAPGKELNVFREYDYVVPDNNDGVLEIYFMDGGERTYMFLSLKFQKQDDEGYWVASNDHLCIKDLYQGTFRVKLDGLTAKEIIITYRVEGPAKDYESTTIMTRKKTNS
ncbi:unnamed protein product [Cylindrotheca closterium]|uniref:DUF6314 domain-containing protein n=1 Tax=Cylindrotheca closterium TaxID=2856 RepID=A0AAD2FQ67_9STRA|nr:unnamed protein product [Cylindrotheca closterium]